MKTIRNVLLTNVGIGLSFGAWMQSLPAGLFAFMFGGFCIALIDYAKTDLPSSVPTGKESP